MTLHSSKGLEFEKIYLIGVEEELLPHKKTIKDNQDINEELRLAYVGLTKIDKSRWKELKLDKNTAYGCLGGIGLSGADHFLNDLRLRASLIDDQSAS